MYSMGNIHIQKGTDVCQIYLLHLDFFCKLSQNSGFATDLGSLMIAFVTTSTIRDPKLQK
jgi:hypothetical protein